MVGQGKLGDAETLGAAIADDQDNPTVCGPVASGNRSADCATVQDDLDTAGTLTTAGIVLASVGGAALITGIVLLVLPRDEPSDEKAAPPPVAIAPWISPEVGGIFVGGHF